MEKKDHGRNCMKNPEMLDNSGSKSGAEEDRTPDLLNAILRDEIPKKPWNHLPTKFLRNVEKT
jgi:hypothetical protein